VLDPAPLLRLAAAAETDARVARAALEKAEALSKLGAEADALELLKAETAVKNAEANLKSFDEVEGRNLVLQSELNVKMSEDNLKDQEEELDQLLKMYKTEDLTSATSEIVVRRAKRAIERTQAFLDIYRKEASAVKSVRHPQQRQAHVFATEAAKGDLAKTRVEQAHARVQREADLARAKAAAAQADEQVAKLKRDLEGFTVRASFDGRVFHGQFQGGAWATAEQVSPLLRPGEKLQAGQVLLTVCGAKTFARAELPEASYFDAAAEQAATVAPSARPEAKREGRVRSKSAVAQVRGAGPAFEARIELTEPFADLLPGMKARATLKGAELKGVVLVPSPAIVTSDKKPTVQVSKDGKASAREVVVGRTDGRLTEIRGGLEAGEKVVLPK
jgi:hypothetical protein